MAITRATDRLSIHWARRRNGYQRRITPLIDGFESTTPPVVGPPPTLQVPTPSPLTAQIERLKSWRADAARATGLVPEAVCSDVTLRRVAEQPPADAAALDAVTGLGMLTSRRLFPGISAALAEPT